MKKIVLFYLLTVSHCANVISMEDSMFFKIETINGPKKVTYKHANKAHVLQTKCGEILTVSDFESKAQYLNTFAQVLYKVGRAKNANKNHNHVR